MSDRAPTSSLPGEFDLIHRYFAPLATAPGAFGLTDDGALFDVPEGETCAVTTDTMVAGVHFFDDDPPTTIGWKLLAVSLSDLAAMGAAPLGYTLNLAVPRNMPGAADWVAAFADGLKDCQVRFGTSLVGGDTVSTDGPLTLSITAFGSVPKDRVLRRSGAKIGDSIWVSGTIGDAALAVKIRNGWVPPEGLPTEYARHRLQTPFPRLALGKALRGIATAALDISDGLAADLGHICEASDVGAEVRFADVPLTAEMRSLVEGDPAMIPLVLTGGDDYELVFTAPSQASDAVRAASGAAATPVSRLGRIVAGGGVRIEGPDGRPIALDRLGFTHF